MSAPVPQDHLLQVVLPILRESGRRYRKFREVMARRAVPGERIVTVTSSGVETENVASGDAMVVRNLTQAREEYVVERAVFSDRYELIRHDAEGWAIYNPSGVVIAVEIGETIVSKFGVAGPLEIIAPWNEPQKVHLRDYLVSPPSFGEVYRIGRSEFLETYRPLTHN